MSHVLSSVVSRTQESKTGWSPLAPTAAVALIGLLAGTPDARAESPSTELLSASLSSMLANQEAVSEEAIEEIVVIGLPHRVEIEEPDHTLDDEAMERILRDFEQHQQVEEELEWRMDGVELKEQPTSFRIGYDVRDEERGAVFREQELLPLDLVTPAVVISMDF